jgi:ATP synthase protein I
MIVPAARVIRLGMLLTAALAVPAVGISAGLRGGSGALAAALGLAIVVAFFSISKLAVGAVARRAPHHLLPAALGTYALKIALLGALLLAIQDSSALDLPAFAWSIFAGVFVWMGAELWVATHTRVPFFDPDRPGAWDATRRPPVR